VASAADASACSETMSPRRRKAARSAASSMRSVPRSVSRSPREASRTQVLARACASPYAASAAGANSASRQGRATPSAISGIAAAAVISRATTPRRARRRRPVGFRLQIGSLTLTPRQHARPARGLHALSFAIILYDMNRRRSPARAPRRRGRHPLPEAERKGRLIQARVDDDLDATLRSAAQQKRVSVSQLVRNVLEDTFRLVDDVVAGAASIGEAVSRDARRLAASAKGRGQPPASGRAAPPGRPQPAPAGRSQPAAPGRSQPTAPGRGQPSAPVRAAPGRGQAAAPGRGPAAPPGRGQASAGRGASSAAGRPSARTAFDQVAAWQEVVLNRAEWCAVCAAPMSPGDRALIGLTESPLGPRIFIHARCR